MVDANCDLQPDSDYNIYEFEHKSTGDLFLAWTKNNEVISQVENELSKPLEERNMHINGVISRLPAECNINLEWSWYFNPEDWMMADISIEVCDGNPQYVEENLAEFVDNVGRFCPWGSRVKREINP